MEIKGYYQQVFGLSQVGKAPYYDTRINQELVGCLNHPSGFQILVNSPYDDSKVWINVKEECLISK